MQFYSTRDKFKKLVSSSEAIVTGLAPDGGLYVPENFPQLGDFQDISYNELALKILKLYLTDFEEDELKEYIEKAYSKYNPVKLNGGFLELFHGATLAFKDVALQLFPYLLTASLKKQKIEKTAVILAATSGDTGSAVLNGIAGVKNTKAVVIYPKNGVSLVQRLQMVTRNEDNVHVFAINGNFDDAQNTVKQIFSDHEYQKEFSSKYFFTSANSINLGRLLPQIVYYFFSYQQLLQNGTVSVGEKVNFCVPTGNFGNILAGFYAHRMGLPINKLIVATNKNDVLDEYFKTKEYNYQNREFHLTMSPSMDILISSNLERLIFDEDNLDLGVFASGSATDEETVEAIKGEFETNGYIIDPHTAVAKCVYEKYKKDTDDNHFTIIVSTASPYKFEDAVKIAIGEKLNDVPEQIRGLAQKPVVHNKVVDDLKEAIKGALL